MNILELLNTRRRHLDEQYKREASISTYTRRSEVTNLIATIKERRTHAAECPTCGCMASPLAGDTSTANDGGYVDGGGV